MTQPVIDSTTVLVAGVPWPRYKLVAIIAGVHTLLLVGAVTASAGPAVLGGAGVAVAVGLVTKLLTDQRD
jgi:hypothetical protein